MPYDEFLSWVEYARKRGTLNVGLRLEWLFARTSFQINRACRGNAELEDFVRYHDQPEERIATLADFAKVLGFKPKKENSDG